MKNTCISFPALCWLLGVYFALTLPDSIHNSSTVWGSTPHSPETVEGARLLATSLGQLVRRSEFIVLAEIVRPVNAQDDNDVLFEAKVERIYFGNAKTVGDRIMVKFADPQNEPLPGERAILFLTRKWSDPIATFFWDWATRIDNVDGSALAHWRILDPDRARLIVDTNRLALIDDVIIGYVRQLRGPRFNKDDYARFLASLSEHGDERVREDNRLDISSFLRWLSPEEQDEMLTDDSVPQLIRDRIIQRRAYHADSVRTRSLEEVETQFVEFGWNDKIESGDGEQMRMAFRFLGRFGHHELRQHQRVWVPALRTLLHSDDPDWQWRAASMLSIVQDRDSITIMLKRLRDPAVPHKRALVNDLQRATGEVFPFDPDAPEEVREEQIQRWEEWWAGENAREE
jgi:hypothetical protein